MSESMSDKVAKLAAEAKKKKAALKKTEDTKTADSETTTPDNANKPSRQSGKSAARIGRDVEKILKQFAQQQGIEQFSLFPGNEYPTPFTRIPLFPPIQRRKARENVARETQNADFVKLESRWDKAGVWKAGPALTVYDEDTLAGLMHMRSIGFSGNEQRMPSKLLTKEQNQRNIIQSAGKDIIVHAVYCVVSQLESKIRGHEPPNPSKGWGGAVIKRRRESLERLAGVSLKFERPHSLDMYRGKTIHIIELDWIGDREDACYYVQFHPAIVSWLLEYRTFLDMGIRRELTPFGKALHRFLSSQVSNRHYKIELEVLVQAMGWQGKQSEAKKLANDQLTKMQSLGFLKQYQINGTGRREPFVIEVWF
jgi:hypothetical protein